MKLKSTLFALVTLITLSSLAHALDVEGKSIRMRVSAEDIQDVGLRYANQDDQIDTSFSGENAFVFNRFNVINNLLFPAPHAVTVFKNGNILTLSFSGDNDAEAERMYNKTGGTTDYLYLPSDVEIATANESAVEILDENGEPVHAVTENQVNFVAPHEFQLDVHALPALEEPEVDQGQDGQGNGGGDDQGNQDLGDESAASGGCSMSGSAPLAQGLWVLFALALSALGLLRRVVR